MDSATNPIVQTVSDPEKEATVDYPIAISPKNEEDEESRQHGILPCVVPDSPQISPAIPSPSPDDSPFPEGGLHAWLVVVGAWLILFASFGFMVSIGTVQEYLHSHQLSAYTTRDVGWIPSVFVYLSLGLGIWVGPVFDRYGPRYLALIGSTLYVVMVFLLAECQTYWQFMLCMGVFGGVTGATLPTTSLAAVSHWFEKRRGLAHGIAMIGSSFGGTIIPLMLRAMFPKFGYKWSIRILAFTFLGCLAFGNILLKARLKPGYQVQASSDASSLPKRQSIISFRIFGDFRFSLLTVAVFGFEIVLFGSLGLLPTYATLLPSSSSPSSNNSDSATGFNLIAVMNGVSCLGRILPSFLADRYGRFNVMIITTSLTLLLMFVLWLPLDLSSNSPSTIPILYTFTGLFGFGTGSWMALTPACIGQLCHASEFGRYYGTLYFVASLATLVCIPIGGELLEAVGPRSLVAFFCAILAVALAAFFGSRWACFGMEMEVEGEGLVGRT